MTWWHSFGAGKSHSVVIAAILSVMVPTTAWAHGTPGVSGDLLASWSWRPDVIAVVAAFAAAYILGWWRLWQQGARIARRWQFALYPAGLAIICLALISPIDSLSASHFFIHMTQHKLLTMVGPPLLLLADPLPIILWGLPRNVRHQVGHLLTRDAVPRRILRSVTWMPVAWLLYVVNLWAWHHPTAYGAALRSEFLHDIEHLSFFLTALLFWWPVVNPAPRVHGHIHHGLRIVYMLAGAFQTAALGFVIAASNRVLYPHYATTPRLWNLSPLHDQALGGGIMSEGGMMHVIAVLVLAARMLDYEEQMTRQREARTVLRGITEGAAGSDG